MPIIFVALWALVSLSIITSGTVFSVLLCTGREIKETTTRLVIFIVLVVVVINIVFFISMPSSGPMIFFVFLIHGCRDSNDCTRRAETNIRAARMLVNTVPCALGSRWLS